jgi:predicted DNA-binding protein YlxM (UPF0122 family)
MANRPCPLVKITRPSPSAGNPRLCMPQRSRRTIAGNCVGLQFSRRGGMGGGEATRDSVCLQSGPSPNIAEKTLQGAACAPTSSRSCEVELRRLKVSHTKAQRRAKARALEVAAWAFYCEGRTLIDIAAQYHVTHQAVHKAIKRAIARAMEGLTQDIREQKAEQVERLKHVYRRALDQLEQTNDRANDDYAQKGEYAHSVLFGHCECPFKLCEPCQLSALRFTARGALNKSTPSSYRFSYRL